MDYQIYISSKEWEKKREMRKALDGFKCRLCDHDGSSYRIEVHHRPSSYKLIPNESVENDLITVCARCHVAVTNAIRGDRYDARVLPDVSLKVTTVTRKDSQYGMARSKVQIDISLSNVDAQRADRRSNEQVVEVDQTDFVKARQNR